MAWLNGWAYRKSHLITASAGAGTNFQVGIKCYHGSGVNGTEARGETIFGKVYLDSHNRTDFGDVRFTQSDGTTLLDYWVKPKNETIKYECSVCHKSFEFEEMYQKSTKFSNGSVLTEYLCPNCKLIKDGIENKSVRN